MIFRKVQIVVDVVVVAAVQLLLQDAVGVLDRRWKWFTAVVAGTVEVLILFQLVNQRTPLLLLLLGVTTAASTVVVVLQYPGGRPVIVQLLVV